MPRPERIAGESAAHFRGRVQVWERHTEMQQRVRQNEIAVPLVFRNAQIHQIQMQPRVNVGDEVWDVPEDAGNVPRTVGRGNILNVNQIMDAYFESEVGVPEKATPYTPNQEYNPKDKKHQEMAKAVNEILESIEVLKREKMRNAPRKGRREAEYDNQQEQAYVPTGRELLDSDLPVYLPSLNREQCRDIRNSGNWGIYPNPSNRYEFGWSCRKCEERPPAELTFLVDGFMYCAKDVPNNDMCSRCSELREDCEVVPQFDGQEVMLCKNCREGLYCRQCEEKIDSTHAMVGLCDDHLNAVSNRHTNRTFSKGILWVGKEAGEIVKSLRIFSCEIEVGVPSPTSMSVVAKNIPPEAGMGHDGSIQLLNAFEIQSPKLAGLTGEKFVYATTSVLHSVGAVVNESCGLHIHLDGKGIVSPSRKTFPAALLQLWKAHLVFEDVMLSFLPFPRRRNDYCRPMGESFNLVELHNVGSLLDAERLWYKKKTFSEVRASKGANRHPSRYFGVNLHSLLTHGHLEIRYHSGTTNPHKILEWANLHCLIMDAATHQNFTNDFLQEAHMVSSLKERTDMLFDLIGLSKSSRDYFHTRQKKFMDKRQAESNSLTAKN